MQRIAHSFLALLATACLVCAENSVIRVMPSTCNSGQAFGISNVVSAIPGVFVYAVEDEVPPGWTVARISHFGRVDAVNRKIKWGPFFDDQPRTLAYEATAPAEAIGLATFDGVGSFDGAAAPITGATAITVLAGQGDGRNEIVSGLPPAFLPGAPFMLTNSVRLGTGVLVYSVEDQIPAGWTASRFNHGGAFDSINRKLKWGPFLDGVARVLICEVTPPASTVGSFTFSGTGSFDGAATPITGGRQTRAITSVVVRDLPQQFQPTEPLAVTLIATPNPDVRVFAVEEQVPEGWSVDDISNDGAFDAVLRTIKWGPFFTSAATTLTYRVTPPLTVANTAVFTGTGSFEGVAIAITGDTVIDVARSRVVRLLPGEVLPGMRFMVTNAVAVDLTVSAYAVEDEVPENWPVENVSHGGQFDAAHRKVKWGPFFDQEARELSFVITAPPGSAGVAEFAGIGSFDGSGIAISGDRQTRLISPASLNTVTRRMPESVRAGRSAIVTNMVLAAATVSVYAIEDEVPAGWTATDISHAGQFDATQHKVKWEPFFDADARQLRYRLVPAPDANGLATLRGTGSFDGLAAAITGSESIVAIANHAPVARTDSFEREPGQTLFLPVELLLANDGDPDGDAIEFVDFDSTGLRGAVESVDGELVYTPAAGIEPDSFDYTIRDEFGMTSGASVSITVRSAGQGLNITGISMLDGGAVRVKFLGIPARTYAIQAAPSLEGPSLWTTIGSRTASIRGEFEFDDIDAPKHTTRFYRSARE